MTRPFSSVFRLFPVLTALILLVGIAAPLSAQSNLFPQGEISGISPEVIGTGQTRDISVTVRSRGLGTNFWMVVVGVPPGWQVTNLTPDKYFISHDNTRDFRLRVNPGIAPGNYSVTVQLWADDVFNDPRLLLTEGVDIEVITPPSDFRIILPQQDEVVSPIFNITWQRANNTDSYDLRVRRLDQGTPVNPPVYQLLGTTDTNVQLNADELLEPGKFYRITVEANNRVFKGVSAQNSPMRFETQPPTPLGAFQLTSPSPGGAASLLPNFTWTASANADSYSIAVFPSDDGVLVPSPIGVVEGITGTSYQWQEPQLSGGQEYYVSVSAQGLAGSRVMDGGPSPFVATAIGEFALLSPNNNAQRLPVRPVFRWENSGGAQGYRILIFEVIEGEPDLLWIEGDVPQRQGPIEYHIPSHRRLRIGTEYSWVVVAYTGNETLLNAGGGRRFRTSPMGGFSLISPEPLAEGVSDEPLFEWEPTDDVFGYFMEITEPLPTGKPDPDKIRRSTPTTQTQLQNPFGPLEEGTRYLWRVGATDNDIIVWNSPNWQPFTVGPLPDLGEFDLVSPANDAEGVAIQPIFQWQTSDEATGYRLHLWVGGTHKLPPIEIEGQVSGVDLLDKGIRLNGMRNYTWTVEAIAPGAGRFAGSERSFTTTFREEFSSCDLIEHLLGIQKFSTLDQQVIGLSPPFDITGYLRFLDDPAQVPCEP